MKIIKEFRDYMTKDDILKSAGAFLIALTLRELILQFIKLVINPIISLFFHIEDLSTFQITLINTNIQIGALFEAILNFIILSFTIFLVVKFSEKTKLIKKEEKEEITILKEINANLYNQLDSINDNLKILNKGYINKEQLKEKEELITNDTNSEEILKSLSE